MNVTGQQKALANLRPRGRGRGKAGNINNNKDPRNLIPKYRIPEFRRPLVNYRTASSSTPKTIAARSTTTPRNSSSTRRGTRTTDTTTSTSAYGEVRLVILAVTMGRGLARGEVGMAAIDLQYPHVILCQMSDDNSFINALTKINVFDPVEILMPNTMGKDSNNPNSLYTVIKKHFKNIEVTEVSRVHWNATDGLERIQTHCIGKFSSIELIVRPKYYALSAVNSLLKYIEYVQYIVYTPKSVKFEYQVAENTTMIDLECAKNLELVTSCSSKPDYCLLGALDRCSTPAGRRLLRASILQPPCDIRTIFNRQECINELVTNKSLFSMMHAVVRRLHGAHRLLSFVTNQHHSGRVESAERNLNFTLMLKHILEVIPEFKTALTTATSPFFQNVLENLKNENFEIMKEEILRVVNPEAQPVKGYPSSKYQRCFAIRKGICDSLDVARQTFIELTQGMAKTVADLGNKYNLDLYLECSQEMEYHIEMRLPKACKFDVGILPEEFIEVYVKSNIVVMTTQDLFVTNQHCRQACDEIHLMADIVLSELFKVIRDRLGCLFQFNDNVAEVDVILSLATISSISDFVRPTFGPSLDVKDGKHPVMDIMGSESPTPNDIFASVAYNFHIIAGPNMGGKTVYLKQIVLLQIMAQIGCFVPAIRAQFRMTDHIFCRIGVRDSLEFNSSSFSLEMKEMEYTVQSLTPNSLVILDELCRSTSVEEGASIAWAISKRLLLSQAFTFSATHFEFLLKMAEIYPNVTNHYMEAIPIGLDRPEDIRLVYTHHLKKGIQKIQNYGLILARATGLPEEILKNAEAYAKQIQEEMEVNKSHESAEAAAVPVESTLKRNYDKLAPIVEDMTDDEEINDEELLRLVRGFESISYEEPPSEEDTSSTIYSEGPKRDPASETPGQNKGQSSEIPSSTDENTEDLKKSSKRRVMFMSNLESEAKVPKVHYDLENHPSCSKKLLILEDKRVSLSMTVKKPPETVENRQMTFQKPAEVDAMQEKHSSPLRAPLRALNSVAREEKSKDSPFKVPARPFLFKKSITEDPESPFFIPSSQSMGSIPNLFTPESTSESSTPGTDPKSLKNPKNLMAFYSLTPNLSKNRKKKSILGFIPQDFCNNNLLAYSREEQQRPLFPLQETSQRHQEDVIASLPAILRPVSHNTIFPDEFSHLGHLTKNIYQETEVWTSSHTKPPEPYFLSDIVKRTPVTNDSDVKDQSMERMDTDDFIASAEQFIEKETGLVIIKEEMKQNIFKDVEPNLFEAVKENQFGTVEASVFENLEHNLSESKRSTFVLPYDQQSIISISSMDSEEAKISADKREAAIFRRIEENDDEFFDNFMK